MRTLILTALKSCLLACVLCVNSVTFALASDSWAELKQLLYKDKTIAKTSNQVILTAPYRATDDRRVPIDIKVQVPPQAVIKTMTLVIDENPMPVSAVFQMGKSKNELHISTFMRLNGPSSVRAIVETNDGTLYMAEKFVKTSGLGACSAPPIGDPKELMANLGKMELTHINKLKKEKATQVKRQARLKIQHPNLTGLQMDQITLQYILARFVKTVEVSQGEEKLFTLTGSISFSENPELTFDYKINEGDTLKVRVVDTDKAEFKKTFPVGFGS